MFKRLRQLSLLRPLEARSFRLLWAGEGLSLLADQVFIVVLTLLVSRITGTGVELGAVLAVASVPGAVLMPLGGILSDRFSPAGVMVFASIGRAVLLGTVAGLVLTDSVGLWHLYAIGGALSALDALYYPASLSILPALVHEERLAAANSLVQGAEQASGIAGPALAEQRLGGTAAFGIFLSAFGGGSLIGVVLAGSIRRARHRGLTVLGVAVVFGLGLVALGFVPGLPLALAVAATMGVGAGYLGVVLVAWLQERVEAGVRGRVMSLVVFAVVALDPISYALAGAMMELGLTVTFASAGAFMLLITVLFGATSRAVLEFD